MAFVRTLLLAVLAIAVAVAPAAPCTMMRHAASDHVTVPVRAASHHHHAAMTSHAGHEEASGAVAPHSNLSAAERAMGAANDATPPAAHQHQHKRTGHCPATCCPLACQAALPTASWSGAVPSVRPSEPVGMAQEDGVVDMHPVRIERPPRPTA